MGNKQQKKLKREIRRAVSKNARQSSTAVLDLLYSLPFRGRVRFAFKLIFKIRKGAK